MDAQGELRSGDVFAGHRIEGVAGRGGMGVVYRATALDLDRLVALKLIAPALSSDLSFRERFIRETRVAASLDHPNVIPVFAAGEEGGRLFFSMRYVDGDDLRTLIRREGRLDPAHAASIVSQIGNALDAAHRRGIVHRDVKPANVLLAGTDHAYLTDFGLTKRLHSASGGGETRAGGWVGTLGYVAPEQIRGERVDARADVYALGCILFHALTGMTPYARESDEATLWAHLNEPPPAVTPRAPAAFEEIIARALAKAPDDRFPSAGDLGRAALAAAGQAPRPGSERVVAQGAAAPTDRETVVSPGGGLAASVTPEAPTILNPPEASRRRRGPLLAGLAVVLLLGAGGAALALTGDDEEPAPPPTTQATTRKPASPTGNPAGKLSATLPVGPRPNALVVSAGKLWVASNGENRLRLFDAGTNEPVRSAPKVGVGTAALDAGFGSVWIAKGTTQTLLRYGSRSLARSGPPIELPPGTAATVATGERGVWVGSRSGRDGVDAQTVTRVDYKTNAFARPPLIESDGVQDLTVGDGAVWVVGRRVPALTRIDVSSGDEERIRLGGDPQRIAIGGGAVWVSNDDGSVGRIDLGTRNLKRIGVGKEPRGIAVGKGAVWVANSLDGTATRLDTKTGDVVGEPVRVGGNPSAVTVSGSTAWISLLADNAVARVDFTAP